MTKTSIFLFILYTTLMYISTTPTIADITDELSITTSILANGVAIFDPVDLYCQSAEFVLAGYIDEIVCHNFRLNERVFQAVRDFYLWDNRFYQTLEVNQSDILGLWRDNTMTLYISEAGGNLNRIWSYQI